jgi:hypothetical protein
MEKRTQLELKDIAAYLPYGLKIDILNYKCDYVGIQYAKANGFYELTDGFYVTYHGGSTGKSVTDFKPILRPLSDLFSDKLNPIPINETKHLYGWDYLWYDVYKNKEPFNLNVLKWAVLSKLLEWHFDVFGLIDAGLAVDINTINL